MKRLLASLLLPAALAAHAQIATGSATVGAGGNTVFPPRIYKAPGLVQIRNGNLSTVRRELGPVMGFVNGKIGSVGSYTSPLDGVVSTWSQNDSWAYEGEMFMESGTTYTFGTQIDDYATITIDGTIVLDQPQCAFTTGTYLCQESGWHSISVQVRDIVGEYGIRNWTYGNRNWTTGVGVNVVGDHNKNGSGWKRLVDPGDGSMFRTMVTNSGVRVTAQMRESDPTVMDVDYIVYADPETTPTVNVRALAFEDGERGFATVVRPETFIEGTDANLGDGIAANVAHRLSWKVSSDWATDLAKVKFEVMAMKPGDLLLPDMHFVTIPAADGHPKTIVSVNDLGKNAYSISKTEVYNRFDRNEYARNKGFSGQKDLLNAALWFYASKEPGSFNSGGIFRISSKNGSLCCVHAAFGMETSYIGSISPSWSYEYVFWKMGFRILGDVDEIKWINEATRLNLSPSGYRQYAVKTVEE